MNPYEFIFLVLGIIFGFGFLVACFYHVYNQNKLHKEIIERIRKTERKINLIDLD
jgi:hypothetical protein